MSEIITNPIPQVAIITGGTAVGKTTMASYVESSLGFPSVAFQRPVDDAYRATFRTKSPVYGTPSWVDFCKFRELIPRHFGSCFWALCLREFMLPGGIVFVEGDLSKSEIEALYKSYDVVGHFHVVRDYGAEEFHPGAGVVMIENCCPWQHTNNPSFFVAFLNEILDKVCKELDVPRPKTALTSRCRDSNDPTI